MRLTFRGHDDRYAIEQSLLAFFPEERPVYEGEDGDSHAEVTLHEGNVYATGVTTLTYGGKTARGEARVRIAGVSDAYERERLRQRALKLSFFRAARDVTGVTPSWGALTGIRPGKLARAMLTRYGMSDEFDMVALETVNNQYLGGDTSLACSAQTQCEIDQKVVDLVKAQHAKAVQILTDNRAKLDELAQYLYQKETITGDEFMEILNRNDS